MKIKSFFAVLALALCSLTAFAQNTGTLKIFSDEPITVFVDQVQQAQYDAILLVPGTHFVKINNQAGLKVYSQIVTIIKDQITSVLVEGEENGETPKADVPKTEKVSNSELNNVKGTQKTGTLNIFSELAGCSIYLDELFQGIDVKTIPNVPIGDHYLKVMRDGISIFGELVTIKEGQVTTVLVKNDGQVSEKIMEGKVNEREEYQAKKVDILFTSNSVSQTKGTSTYFPGYYSYWGFSNSVTNTTQIADFKVVQGGVSEISDIQLAQLAKNQAVINNYTRINASIEKQSKTGALVFLGSLVIGVPVIIDVLSTKKPFLHPVGTTAPDWEIGVAAGAICVGTISYAITIGADKKRPKHYYRVQDAAADAQTYNKQLKKDLGLPESYDVK